MLAQRGVRVSHKFIRTVTEKLTAYTESCAHIELTSSRIRDWGSNCAENSHQTTWRPECWMNDFKPVAEAQRFLSIFSGIGNFFELSSHRT